MGCWHPPAADFEHVVDNGNQTLDVIYYWNNVLHDWIGDYKKEYSYDENANQTLSAYYNWDSDLNNWVGSQKFKYAYDENSNQTLSVSYGWDSDLNNWVNYINKKIEKTYLIMDYFLFPINRW